MTEYKVGDKVRFIDESMHANDPDHFPRVGTIGTVKKDNYGGTVAVQWPKGSTKGDDLWACSPCRIELAEAASTRASLLAAAEKCVCHDRETQYGTPENNFGLIARYWTLYLDGRSEPTAKDVGIMLALLKVARIQSGQTKEDNYVDAIGYMACAGEIALKEDENHDNG